MELLLVAVIALLLLVPVYSDRCIELVARLLKSVLS
jgi:hypothetical protein